MICDQRKTGGWRDGEPMQFVTGDMDAGGEIAPIGPVEDCGCLRLIRWDGIISESCEQLRREQLVSAVWLEKFVRLIVSIRSSAAWFHPAMFASIVADAMESLPVFAFVECSAGGAFAGACAATSIIVSESATVGMLGQHGDPSSDDELISLYSTLRPSVPLSTWRHLLRNKIFGGQQLVDAGLADRVLSEARLIRALEVY